MNLRGAVPLLLVIAALPWACGGGGESTRERLEREVAVLQDKLSFDIVVPGYLPADTADQGNAYVAAGRLSLFFPSEASVGERRGVSVEIDEAGSNTIPLVPTLNPGVEATRVGGYDASVIRTEAYREPSIEYQIQTGDVFIALTVTWFGDPEGGAELTPEMEQTALQILESMLED